MAFFLLFLIGTTLCPAQEADIFWNGIGKTASFGKPFWADLHSTLIRAEIANATNSPDYDWGVHNSSNRFYVFANIGVDIPVWSGSITNSRHGLSLTLPVMVDIWLDFFERTTSPIINTSYRFGFFETNFIFRLPSPITVLPIYNWSIKYSPIKHESTHIGDELAIYRKDLGLPITRVDVVTNYTELIFTLNDPDGQARSNHGFKFGIMFNYKIIEGWYTVLEQEADPDAIEPGLFPFEFHLQYQYQSPLFSRGFQMIASAEYRLRQRYKYSFSHPGLEDNENPYLVNSFNIMAGIRYDNRSGNYFSKIGVGARLYYGLNPYGQFRSMPGFRQFGLMAIFE